MRCSLFLVEERCAVQTCSSVSSRPSGWRIGRGALCAQTCQRFSLNFGRGCNMTRRPLALQRATHGEKMCCLTSEEGFDCSAPMFAVGVAAGWIRDDDVGARACRSGIDGSPKSYDGTGMINMRRVAGRGAGKCTSQVATLLFQAQTQTSTSTQTQGLEHFFTAPEIGGDWDLLRALATPCRHCQPSTSTKPPTFATTIPSTQQWSSPP